MTWPLTNPTLKPPGSNDPLGRLVLVAFVIVLAFLACLAFAEAGPRHEIHTPAEPDTRPVIWAYTSPGCQPCRRLHHDSELKPLSQFRFVFSNNPPKWVENQPDGWAPTLHYMAGDGSWKRYRGWGPGAAEQFAARWRHWNPEGGTSR